MTNILGMKTPFSQWVDPRRDMLMGAAAGLAGGGLPGMWQGAMQGRAVDLQAEERAREIEQQNATAEWLKANYPQFAGLPPAQGFDAAMKMMAQARTGESNAFDERFFAGQQYGLRGDDLNTFALTGSVPGTARSNVTYGVTPIYGRDDAGKMVMGVQGSDGTFKRVDTGEVQPLGPYDTAAQRAAGTAFGKETGGAQFDVPSAELATQQTLDAIQAIRAEKKGMDEQFGNILGVPQQMTPAYPGSDKAKFQVAVARGANLAFLQGREMLRGGGQITDFESKKAETAITNMQIAMEKGDKAQFEAALNTFEEAVKDGLAKLKTQAGTIAGYGGSSPASSGGGTTSSGVTWKVK